MNNITNSAQSEIQPNRTPSKKRKAMTVASFTLGIAALCAITPVLRSKMKEAARVACLGNMVQIGESFNLWADAHAFRYPFHMSTNEGGTMELCKRDSQGFDEQAAFHFQVMSNLIVRPNVLICPGDRSSKPASNFQELKAINISYQVRSGNDVDARQTGDMLFRCPIHRSVFMCDGSLFRADQYDRFTNFLSRH